MDTRSTLATATAALLVTAGCSRSYQLVGEGPDGGPDAPPAHGTGCDLVAGPDLVIDGRMRTAPDDLVADGGDLFWHTVVDVIGLRPPAREVIEVTHNARGPLYGVEAVDGMLYYGRSTDDRDALMAFDRGSGARTVLLDDLFALDVAAVGDSVYVATCGGVVHGDRVAGQPRTWPISVTGECPFRVHGAGSRVIVESFDGVASLSLQGDDPIALPMMKHDAFIGAIGDHVYHLAGDGSPEQATLESPREIVRTFVAASPAPHHVVSAAPGFAIADATLGVEHLHWLEDGGVEQALRCVQADGGTPATLLSGLDSATHVAVDGDRLYWIELRPDEEHEALAFELWSLRVGTR